MTGLYTHLIHEEIRWHLGCALLKGRIVVVDCIGAIDLLTDRVMTEERLEAELVLAGGLPVLQKELRKHYPPEVESTQPQTPGA